MARKESNPEQRYACDRPGCNKSYSRPDHLLRHKLNHDVDRVLCCNQCDRTFVRQDLLVRHLERHALRGKTLGRWSNKNRDKADTPAAQEDASGSTRPRQRRGNKAAKLSHDDQDSEDDDGDDDDTQHRNNPSSDVASGLSHHPDAIAAATLAYPHDPSSAGQASSSNYNIIPESASAWSGYQLNQPGSSTAFTNPQWSPPAASASSTTALSPHNGSASTAPYAPPHASYRADSTTTGMGPPSRNTPGGGANQSGSEHPFDGYGRDSVVWNDESTQASRGAAGTDTTSFRWLPPDDIPNEGSGSYAPPPSGSYYSAWTDPSSSIPSGAATGAAASTSSLSKGPASYNDQMPSANQDIFPFAPPTIDHTADYGWLFDGMDPFGSSSLPGLGKLGPPRGQSQSSSFSPSSSDGLGGFLGNFSGTPTGQSRQGGNGDSRIGRGMSSDGLLMSGSEADTPNALEDLAYFASLQAEIPSKITYHVDPVAHHRLLIFLQSVSELPNSPLFTPSALRCYIYLFFVKFNRLYPLIHEPTFSASTTDPMLLSAIVVIGAHYAGLPAHELAVRIAQKIWGAIVSLEDFRPARATLPMLQAMVLTECFGKEMSTRPQHEMAHLFHNFIITLARRNAVFNASAVNQGDYEESEEHWRSWAREEEKKRIALFAFMLDAQHATTFRHIPALSAFQIQLNLPCSDDEWSKGSPESWFQLRRRPNFKPASPFIPALKACLSPGKTPQELDAFPRFVLLHGLMSIAYDLQWKQNVLLGAENSTSSKGGENGIGNWKDRLSAAYSSLQARMDIAYIKADDESSTKIIHRATPSLVSAAQITLFADIIDIQIYAGLPSVLGRFIDRATFNASRRSVKDWAKTSDGRTAVWYAVNFLRTSLLGSGTESFGTIQPWKTQSEEEKREKGQDTNGQRARSPHTRKSADKEPGLDEVLHHRWCQYLCALVIWAYGHALSASRGSARQGVNMPEASLPLQAPYPSTSRSTGSGSSAKAEGVEYLERMSTKSPEDIGKVECKCYTRGVLELVEKELRGSRWELGREASGVLRKLVANHVLPHWNRDKDPASAGESASHTKSTLSATVQPKAESRTAAEPRGAGSTVAATSPRRGGAEATLA